MRFVVLFCLWVSLPVLAAKPPNIILILADDWAMAIWVALGRRP